MTRSLASLVVVVMSATALGVTGVGCESVGAGEPDVVAADTRDGGDAADGADGLVDAVDTVDAGDPGGDGASNLTDAPAELPPDVIVDTVPDEPPPTADIDLSDLPSAFEEVCERLAELSCQGARDCCAAADGPSESCEVDFVAACMAASTKEQSALEGEHAELNDDNLEACLQATADAALLCRVAAPLDQQTVCASIVVDIAKAGELCATDAAGLRCAGGKGQCFAEPTGSPCKAWGEAGKLCSIAPCAPNLLCMPPPEPGSPPICDAPRQAGGRCTAHVHCAGGLTCVENVCTAQLSRDAACSKWFECGPGLTCDPMSQQCLPPAKSGESCYSLTHCDDGLSCEDIGTNPAAPTPGTCVPTLCTAVSQ